MSVPFQHHFVAMTTHCALQWYGLDAVPSQRLALQIQTRVQSLERRYNYHQRSSWLSTAINQRRSSTVALDAECARVLALVREHSQHTLGAFDITLATCQAHLQSAQDAQAVAAVYTRLAPYLGLDRWQLNGRKLEFDNPITRLDLGGVIKEHAVDVAADMAQNGGARSGLINFGGDLFAWGRKPDGTRFVAATPHPQAPQKMLFGLDLQDQALTTSAHYARRRCLPDGSTLSHVLGAPPWGQPSAWLSASVVSRSALLSGIYSTALLVRSDLRLPQDTFAVVVNPLAQVHTLRPSASSPCPTTVSTA
jgi:FAD:protein FMN transferase